MMMANYCDYFKELGYKDEYYNSETEQYNKDAILEQIGIIESKWKEKYPELKFKKDKIKFDNTPAFNQSFTTEIEFLNLETK